MTLPDAAIEVRALIHDTAAKPDKAEEFAHRATALLAEVDAAYNTETQTLRNQVAALGRSVEILDRTVDQRLHRQAIDPGKRIPVAGWFVYVLWEGDKPLYVGQSRNVLARLGSHASDPMKRYRMTDITLNAFESEREMVEAEARLIKELQPELNIALTTGRTSS